MAKRIRRFTMTIGGQAVSGARDFDWDDESDWNADRADNEGAGVAVRMSTGGFTVRWEQLAEDSNVATGYVASLVVVPKEVAVASAVETVTDKTHTFADGWIKVGGNFPTENPGRIPVTGWFRTHTGP